MSVLLAAAPVTVAQAQPATCGEVEIVAFSDSGETLNRIIDTAGVTVHRVEHPPIASTDFFHVDEELLDSVEHSRLLGGEHLRERHQECGSTGTRFILAGHSQGVLAAREVARDVPVDWIAGVFGVGDPAQKAGARGVTGGGAGGNGLHRQRVGRDDGTASSDRFYDLPVPAFLFCHDDDPVCAGTPSPDLGPHFGYGEAPEERQELALRLRDLVEAAPAPLPGSGPADLVFAIDTTGSMTPYLAAAAASAGSTADALRALSSKARVGLVEYRDHGGGRAARTVVPLTEDFAAFESGLRGLRADGGGDTPEAVHSGLVTALAADWDSRAARALIVLGDGPAHGTEPVTGLTAAAVTDIARGVAPLPGTVASARAVTGPGTGVRIPPVPVYALAANDSLSAQMDPITSATGGAVFPIGSSDEVGESVVRVVEDATTAPIAGLRAAATVLAGTRTTLSGLGSSRAGDATFAFDFDDDGAIDRSGLDATATHTYPAPGGTKARLVVTDRRGRSSEAVVDVEVRAPDSLRLGEPQPPDSAGGLTFTAAAGVGCVLLGCGILLLVTARRRGRH